jgi:uncharacterized protein (DUF1800 family)
MAATRVMGEFPLSAPAPKGWPDTSDAWSGPDAILNRIEWAKALGDRLPRSFSAAQTAAFAPSVVGPLVQAGTLAAMRSAASAGEAVALLFSSPEFQRR